MGSAIGLGVARAAKLGADDVRAMQMALSGAGLAVAFNAPVGGSLFVFEEVTRSFRWRLVIPTLISVAVAVGCARLIIGSRPDFDVGPVPDPPLYTLPLFAAFGLAVGLLGAGYNAVLMRLLSVADGLHRLPGTVRAALVGAAVGLVLFVDPLAAGGGDTLTQALLAGRAFALPALLGYLVIRFAAGPLSYAAGAPGGLFAPLMALGALAGALFAESTSWLVPGAGPQFSIAMAIVGMSTMFAATVRAPFTGIMLIVEMRAVTSVTVPMLVASGAAVLAAMAVHSPAVYDSLAETYAGPTGDIPQPIRESDGTGWLDLGPRDIWRDRENPDMLVPPPKDGGVMPNCKFSFSDAHMRLQPGGWTREVTNRELPVSTEVAGVDMCLEPGAYRELHWHKETEWGFMITGNARITAIDEEGRYFIDDVVAGDLWNFEAGLPHSIQGLDQGCEFLLVFSDGDFSEYNTFLLSDWVDRAPTDVIAANFKKSVSELSSFPDHELYIFKADVPGPISEVVRPTPQGPVPEMFSFHMENAHVVESEAGTVRIVDVNSFPASKTISAAFVEIEPGGMRELHWHPKASEWQYFVQGKAKMSIFDSSGKARTFNYQAGDVGFIPQVAGHYVQNIGDEKVIYLEVFRNPEYSEVSLNKWLASNPAYIVADHLNVSTEFVESMPKKEQPSPVIWYDQSKVKKG